ncbi:MAG: alpha/beta hydrolase [Chloroflexota bacterium]|nr:alpha/beta hydrolase [Chloroflexota bacterium]
MPKALINNTNIFYEVTGNGFPIVWSHEFGGAYDSWDPQVSYFARRYQVITYNNRGYQPSDVPENDDAYSQDQSVDDLHQLLSFLGIKEAFIGGLSMGGSIALNFGLTHPEMCKGLIVAGAGTGSTDTERFARETSAVADRLETEGISQWAAEYAEGPTRVQLKRKNPKGWETFRNSLLAHSAQGSAFTIRNVQGKRPSLFSLVEDLKKLLVPTLIIAGDEDDPCIEPAIFLKQLIPYSGLALFPQSGHTVNLEEPELFNAIVNDFLTSVEAGRWAQRDPGSGVGFLASKD